MKRRSSSAIFLVLLVLLYLQGHFEEVHGGILYANTTSDLTPYQDNPFRVEHLGSFRVVCPDRAYGLYRVSLEGYNNCSSDGQQLIGHCANTGEISQFVFPFILPGSLVWEIDTTYYLIFKYTVNGSTTPCDVGYKFKVFVYNSSVVTPTPTVMPVSSSSLVITSSSSSIFSQLLTPSFSQSRSSTVSPSSTQTVTTTRPTREQSSSSSSSAQIRPTEVTATSTRPPFTTPTVYPPYKPFSGAASTTASLTLALSLLALLLMFML